MIKSHLIYHYWWGKSASAQFTDVVIKSIVPTGSYEFDWLSTMVRWEFKLKSLDFYLN